MVDKTLCPVGMKRFLFFKVCIPTIGHTQTPNQSLLAVLSSRVKRPCREAEVNA
jgi:hypothetical protein